MKILVIEDEKMLADSIKSMLERKGFQVECVYDGESGKEFAMLGICDLLILDVMLPKMDGFEVARQIRLHRCNTPILMLTARSDVQDRIAGLNAGADYYLSKPFDSGELFASINALLRRQAGQVNEMVFGNTVLDLGTGTLLCDGRAVRLSARGYMIVFADITAEMATMWNLLRNCAIVFLGAMAAFLGISIWLSRWFVRPVEEAWDQQRQFVADASHELKTPLSVIMANAELMNNEDTTPEDRSTYSGNILSTSYQMRSLVENMLEMARVDSGGQKLQFADVDFSQLVSDAVLSVQLLYEEKTLGLHSAIREGIRLQGSEQHLYQVMDVLLDNALKYSSYPGEVSVKLSQAGKSCLLSVFSPGEPIPGEELKRIFKRFYRGDRARAMDGSYGLGLAIAEAVVEAHKGKIWAESGETGNTFYVQLPVSQTK